MAASLRRRGLLAWGAGLFAPRPGRAEAAPRYAVLSLLGDRIVLVVAAPTTGSHLDRNGRLELPDAQGSFDPWALAAAGRALETHQPAAEVSLLRLPPSPLHDEPERLVDGSTLALPDAAVDAIEQARATQVLLLTKHRAPASVRLAQGSVGVGSLRGLGYYIDRQIELRLAQGGATGTGMLVAYAYLRITLADARSGAVLRQRDVTATRVYPLAAHPQAVDPWQVLSAAEKVQRLRTLLERQIGQHLPAVIAA